MSRTTDSHVAELLRQIGCPAPLAAADLWCRRGAVRFRRNIVRTRTGSLADLTLTLGIFDDRVDVAVRPLPQAECRSVVYRDAASWGALVVAPRRNHVEVEITWNRIELIEHAARLQEAIAATCAWWAHMGIDEIVVGMHWTGQDGLIITRPEAGLCGPSTSNPGPIAPNAITRCDRWGRIYLISLRCYDSVEPCEAELQSGALLAGGTLRGPLTNTAPLEIAFKSAAVLGEPSDRSRIELTPFRSGSRIQIAAADRHGHPVSDSIQWFVNGTRASAVRHPQWPWIWTFSDALQFEIKTPVTLEAQSGGLVHLLPNPAVFQPREQHCGVTADLPPFAPLNIVSGMDRVRRGIQAVCLGSRDSLLRPGLTRSCELVEAVLSRLLVVTRVRVKATDAVRTNDGTPTLGREVDVRMTISTPWHPAAIEAAARRALNNLLRAKIDALEVGHVELV